MDAAGVRCDLKLYEGQTHGAFNPENKEGYLQSLQEADQFLTSLGYLPKLSEASIP